MKIKDLFNSDVQEILTEESLTAIQQAFDGKVQLNVESALQEQDDIYAEKLEILMKSIDSDHSKKMTRIIESYDKSNSQKLINIVKNYERALKVEAKNFEKQAINAVSSYLEEFLSEAILKEDIEQAVKNKTAYDILGNLRKVLAVDSILMKESVKGAVLDGKQQIQSLSQENSQLKQQFKTLTESHEKLEVQSLLESKIAKLPEAKKNFLKKTLQDKSLKFIEENFDYTLRLFEKQETQKLKTLKEEAIEQRKIKPDFTPVQKIVTEKVSKDTTETNIYVEELSKMW